MSPAKFIIIFLFFFCFTYIYDEYFIPDARSCEIFNEKYKKSRLCRGNEERGKLDCVPFRSERRSDERLHARNLIFSSHARDPSYPRARAHRTFVACSIDCGHLFLNKRYGTVAQHLHSPRRFRDKRDCRRRFLNPRLIFPTLRTLSTSNCTNIPRLSSPRTNVERTRKEK